MATISTRCAVLFVCLHLGAQERLIKCDLAIINPKGEPITDLRIDDLQLSVDGKPAKIDFFHFLGARKPASVPAERRELSNRQGGAHRNATIILLDLLSERQLTWDAAAQEVVKSVERQESGEDLYLYILNNKGQIEPIHASRKTSRKPRRPEVNGASK